MQRSRKLVLMLVLNAVIGAGAATLAGSPRPIYADDEITSCNWQKCDGVSTCVGAANLDCQTTHFPSECLTRLC